MCGIAGILGATDEALVAGMLDRIAHRGPDGRGIASTENATLGSVRLAIMDPAHGQQPLWNEDGTLACVANGEIYNFRALEEPLKASGHVMATGSDSEVLLHLFEEHGDGFAPMLRGMWAFAMAGRGSWMLGRDGMGIKPLYYAVRPDGAVVFGSEMRAFIGTGLDFKVFPPGHVMTPDRGLVKFWEVPAAADTETKMEDAAGQILGLLGSMVERCLVSDVPVGVFLSGGLDSSLLAALAVKRAGRLKSFTVGYPESDDLLAARRVAEYLGLEHHEYILDSAEIDRDIVKIIGNLESYDRYLVPNGITTWYCARLAAGHVKVVLTGEGADELFAGYPVYTEYPTRESLNAELQRSVAGLHANNLQRVDRACMAHGLEGRVPFMEREIVEFCMGIPVDWKLPSLFGQEGLEKMILRKAAEGLLPDEIVQRKKKAFAAGCGALDPIRELANKWSRDIQFHEYSARFPSAGLRARGEAGFHRIMAQTFGEDSPAMDLVARTHESRTAKPKRRKTIWKRLAMALGWR